MVARLQQFLTVTIVAGSLAGLDWLYQHERPAEGILFAVVLSFGYSLIIAVELVTLVVVTDRTSRPLLRLLFRAWGREISFAARVFYWQQPFRSNVYRDALPSRPDGRAAVLLVHGLLCNRGFWNPWMKHLSSAEIPFLAINLEPMFGSISGHSQQIEDAVKLLQSTTGAAPTIVAHSMGGLAARHWLHQHSGECRVARIFTIGTPHQGTWLARFGRSANAREMALGSHWIRRLAASTTSERSALFTCFYSDCDNAVFPTEFATLQGATNRLISGAGHIDLALRAEVIDEVIENIRLLRNQGAAESESA